MKVLKVCVDPHCDAVWHNCPKKETHCKDCDGRIIEINLKTYWAKFSNNHFQYDFESQEIFRLEKTVYQLEIFNS